MSTKNDEKKKHEGYELADAKLGPLSLAALSIVALMALGVFGVKFLLHELEQSPPQNTVSMPYMMTPSKPALPLLQIDPPVDMMKFREKEDSMVASYAWVSKDSGIARIPVSRAMELLLKQGVPVSATPHVELGKNAIAQNIAQAQTAPAAEKPVKATHKH